MDEEKLDRFESTFEIASRVNNIKHMLEIIRSYDEMSDFEIKAVCREIGKFMKETRYDKHGTPIFSLAGIDFIVTVCKYCFPRFWEKWDLGQFN